jgi:type I restriction enzyme S subunit
MSKWIIKEKFDLPERWKIFRLQDLTTQIVDGTHFTPNYLESGVPFLRVTDIQSEKVDFTRLKFISIEEHELLKLRCFPKKGDILVSKNGSIGIIKIVDWDWEFSIFVSLALIKPKAEIFNQYLVYLLQSDIIWWQIKLRAKQGTVTNLHLEEIRELEIPKPSFSEQYQIAQILCTCDAVIEKTQSAIAKYKAIKQGMLHDLFTRGIDIKTGKLRPKYEDAPELYKESKLGWIPKAWDEKALEDLTNQIGDGIHTTPKYSENTDYYFINGNNLSEGDILIKSALCVSEDEYKKHFKELNRRTILYSINGTIGNIAFYRNEKVILGKSACYIICKPNVNLDYIYFILQSNSISKFYELEMTGSTISNLSLASVRNTPITIPKDDSEQNLIAERIKTINNKLNAEQNYLLKLHQIKAGLMNDLLSGKKKVKLIEDLKVEKAL